MLSETGKNQGGVIRVIVARSAAGGTTLGAHINLSLFRYGAVRAHPKSY
jgi:hypothetical protein